MASKITQSENTTSGQPIAGAASASPQSPPLVVTDLHGTDWGKIGPAAAYYRAGRVWRRLILFHSQRVLFSARFATELQVTPLRGLGLSDDAINLFNERLVGKWIFVTLAGDLLEISLRNAAPALSRSDGIAIQEQLKSDLSLAFPSFEEPGTWPWRNKLALSHAELQESASIGIPASERTSLARSSFKRIIANYATTPLNELTKVVLRAENSRPELFQLGATLEMGFCPGDLFAYVRSAELIPQSRRRWTDVTLAQRLVLPGQYPARIGWVAGLLKKLASAGLSSEDLTQRLGQYGSEREVPPSELIELVDWVDRRIMASLTATPGAHPIFNSQDDVASAELASASLGLTLTRRLAKNKEREEYILLATADTSDRVEVKQQAGRILWLLFEAEKSSGRPRPREQIEQFLKKTARSGTKEARGSQRRMARKRLNEDLAKLNFQVDRNWELIRGVAPG